MLCGNDVSPVVHADSLRGSKWIRLKVGLQNPGRQQMNRSRFVGEQLRFTRRPEFSPEVRERAVRMVLEHHRERLSHWAAIVASSARHGSR